MGVERNKNAYEVAKEATERPGTKGYPERFTSLTHVSRTDTERKWNEAKYWYRAENEMRSPLQRARYDPARGSQGPETEAMKTAVLVSQWYFHLKS